MLTFWEKGFRATSIDDLVARTGASRASLYKMFGDKRDIFLRSVDLYGARFEARADAVLAEGLPMGETARRLLTASAERLGSSDAPAGCLRCNSTLELMGSDAAIDAALDEANRRYLAVMRRVVDRGVAAGEVDPARRDGLALFLTATVAGMVTLARSGTDRAALLSLVEVALAALDRG